MAGLLHRVAHHLEGALAAGVGAKEVSPFEIDAIHLLRRDEFRDLDRPSRRSLQGLHFFWGEDYVLTL